MPDPIEYYMIDSQHVQLAFEGLSVQVRSGSTFFSCFSQKGISLPILENCSGIFQPFTMTAILGPSGCGKTTLLNSLSGRSSPSLQIQGTIFINGHSVCSAYQYKNIFSYVLQQDYILPVFTPRECFKFVIDMRAASKKQQQKIQLVNIMIKELGLTECSDTYVGNNLIRGLSGGQKKRTSIGIQLLSNPSLVFLDEPTTGLDSMTALNLIRLLNQLAKKGKTIVTTIHQPSSQMFSQFHKIMLMAQGKIIYHGDAQSSIKYFSQFGKPIPTFSNPFDHFMKLLNKEGIIIAYLKQGKISKDQQIQQIFKMQLKDLIEKYKQTYQAPKLIQQQKMLDFGKSDSPSVLIQTFNIFIRSGQNSIRLPLGFFAGFLSMIFLALFQIILYEQKATTLDSYIQNVSGLSFTIAMNVSMFVIFGSANVFNDELPVIYRQQQSGTYRLSAYFVGKTLATLPFQLFQPLVLISICYFVINLDHNGYSFLIYITSSWLAMWMSSAYGLLLSIIFSDIQVAIINIMVIMVPLILVASYFAPQENMHDFFKTFEYISTFKYHYQALIYAQFYNKVDGWSVQLKGVNISYIGNIMAQGRQLYIQEPFWLSMFLMAVLGIGLRVICLIALVIKSQRKGGKLKKKINNEKDGAETKVKIFIEQF